mgnify:FL=1
MIRHDDAVMAVKQLLEALGADEGEHTADTPERVARAWQDMLWGYNDDADAHLLKTFPGPQEPGLVIQAGIDVQSVCAHHMLPFGGHATVAYLPAPGDRIVGLSKLTRVAYAYSARLQVQERIGWQIADSIDRMLAPVGVYVVITAVHDCIRLRGARSPASTTTTVARRGALDSQDVALIQNAHVSAKSY